MFLKSEFPNGLEGMGAYIFILVEVRGREKGKRVNRRGGKVSK